MHSTVRHKCIFILYAKPGDGGGGGHTSTDVLSALQSTDPNDLQACVSPAALPLWFVGFPPLPPNSPDRLPLGTSIGGGEISFEGTGWITAHRPHSRSAVAQVSGDSVLIRSKHAHAISLPPMPASLPYQAPPSPPPSCHGFLPTSLSTHQAIGQAIPGGSGLRLRAPAARAVWIGGRWCTSHLRAIHYPSLIVAGFVLGRR